MNLDLSGKTALVCGSSQGIGKAAAVELASLGATIILFSRNEEKLKVVQNELPSPCNQQHSYAIADFSNRDEVKSAVDKILQNHSVHILVNNTGGPPAGKAIDATIEEYIEAFSNHLLVNQTISQAVVPGMKKAHYGRIINVISTSVKQPLPNLGVSNTVRGAVANWAKTLSNELGAYGITVNNVLPGATDTSRLDDIIKSKAEKSGASADSVRSSMASAVPAQRVGQPEEIGAAIAFLASPAASYINGVNLPVDGGRTSSL